MTNQAISKALSVGRYKLYVDNSSVPYVTTFKPPPVKFMEVEGSNSTSGGNATTIDPTRIDGSQNEFSFTMDALDNFIIATLGNPSKVFNVTLVSIVNTKDPVSGFISPIPFKIELEGQTHGPDIGDMVQSSKLDVTYTGRAFSMAFVWLGVTVAKYSFTDSTAEVDGSDIMVNAAQILG